MRNSDDDEQKPSRSRLWIWVALALVLMIGTGAYLVERWYAPMRDAEKLQGLVKAMGGRMTEVDREFASRMEAQQRDSPLATFGPEQAIDAGTRKATREWVTAAIGIIDESLAKREKIPNETIAQIEASRADGKVKSTMVKAIRDAMAKQVPLSVRIMETTRAYLAKIAEMAAYLDLHAHAIQLREGQLEFDDRAAAEHYNKFEHELVALERDLQGLRQQARR